MTEKLINIGNQKYKCKHGHNVMEVHNRKYKYKNGYIM